MDRNLMHYLRYLIMLSTFIDQGDGRWRERDKENLKRDILEFRILAGKLGHEIENFYDDYQHEWLNGDEVDKIQGKFLTKRLNRHTKTIDKGSHEKNIETYSIFDEEIKPYNAQTTTKKPEPQIKDIKNPETESDWPNFEELLQSFGMKYDWKNDRWIKVKQKQPNKKPKKNPLKPVIDNEIHSEKHKFSYSIVKLNKTKSRRNVVVAVSAVR